MTQGLLGDGITQATLIAPAFAVGEDVTVFVSTRGTPNACGGLHPITITTIPPNVEAQAPLPPGPQLPVRRPRPARWRPSALPCSRRRPAPACPCPARSTSPARRSSPTSTTSRTSRCSKIAPSGTVATGVVFPEPACNLRQPAFLHLLLFPAGAHVKSLHAARGEPFSEDAKRVRRGLLAGDQPRRRQVASGIYLAVVEVGGR